MPIISLILSLLFLQLIDPCNKTEVLLYKHVGIEWVVLREIILRFTSSMLSSTANPSMVAPKRGYVAGDNLHKGVDLPAPFGPGKPTISPFSIVRRHCQGAFCEP
ncbi:MAG: hypothetical protein R2744_09425 [Bacteroidales bacterium]